MSVPAENFLKPFFNRANKKPEPGKVIDFNAGAKPEQSAPNAAIVSNSIPRVIPRVVVVGAGFGGLSIARSLSKSEVEVLVLDRRNYHGFWPLLYQVATAGLEPESVAYPVRAILRDYPNVNFQMAEVQGVDFEKRQVLTADGEPIDYDYLVLSAGSTNNYFGNSSLAKHTYGLKDLDEAVELRNRVLSVFEQAVRETDPVKRAALMTFVIVGGGPTGVELAGSFAELVRHVLRKDYPMLNTSETRIMLIEASDHLLAPFSESLRLNAKHQLEQMGVEVKLKTAVSEVDENTVRFKDGSEIASRTVVWAAGVRSALLADALQVQLGRGARVRVAPTLNLPEHPEVFVIGDMAYLEGYKRQAFPMVAPVAIQQGRQAAHNILAQARRKPMRNFRYFDKGSMATIGRKAAVMDAFGIHLTGFFAWLSWLFVHLLFLVGFRNRLIVMANWAYSYFTYDRATRLISGQQKG